MRYTRRKFIRLTSAGLVLPVTGGFLSCNSKKDPSMVEFTEEALRIHREALLVDGHCDMPERILSKALHGQPGFSLNNPQPELQTDIPRLRKGGVDAQFWIAYVPPEYTGMEGGYRLCMDQIDLIHSLVEMHPEDLELAGSVADIRRITGAGKIAPIIGVEGGHAMENSLENLAEFRRQGALYMTLTHNGTHDWADASYDVARNGGLSTFGEEVVAEMNRLGMLADVSHASDDTVRDVLRVSRAPVIASHSSARALCGSRRNLSDELIRGIAAGGGIVMINFFPLFIVPEGVPIEEAYIAKYNELKQGGVPPDSLGTAMSEWMAGQPPMPRCTPGDLVDHIGHIIAVAGIDHVGLGSDYDGITYGPDQMPDVSGFPHITQGMLDRGYREEEIRKVLGENFMRVLGEAEQSAASVTLS